MLQIDFHKLRILVADDNAATRRIVRTVLNGLGTRDVHEADDGKAAFEIAQNIQPDIVTTDWEMPGMSGIELTRALRNEETSNNVFVPVIMITSHSERSKVMAARDAGVTEFLCKPISAKALYARILNVIVNPRHFVRLPTYFGPDRRRFAGAFHGDERRSAEADAHIDPQAQSRRQRGVR